MEKMKFDTHFFYNCSECLFDTAMLILRVNIVDIERQEKHDQIRNMRSNAWYLSNNFHALKPSRSVGDWARNVSCPSDHPRLFVCLPVRLVAEAEKTNPAVTLHNLQHSKLFLQREDPIQSFIISCRCDDSTICR